jgi:tRNA threonylcarbamoyladenosine biosynthesis protein TsaB
VKILAIETSSSTGSAALLEDNRLVAERNMEPGSRHCRELLPLVDALLGDDAASLGLVAVGAGPGSYTGLRVGVTFVKTFCAETGVPAAAVSSLDVIAANAPGGRPVCVVVDARLGMVYTALYDAAGAKTFGDAAVRPEEAARRVTSGTCVLGDGLRRYRDLFAGADVVDDESAWRPRAANAGRLGREKFEQHGADDVRALVPRYLRRPEAEVKWEQSQAGPGPK